MSAQDVRSPDRPKLHFLGADAEEERAALGTAPVLRRNSGGQAGTALRPHAMPASACELAAASRGHKVGTSPRRHSIHGNLSAAPILRRAETVGITRSARSVTLELPMWPASPQSSRSASFSAARLPSSFSAARRSSARANSFTQQCSRSQTQSVPASPSRLRRHSNSVLAHAAALQAARANGSSASGSVRVAHVSPPADRGWISPAGVPSPVESQRADGHPTLVPGVPPVPAPAGEPSRLAAAGCLCLQPLVLDVPRIGEQLPMASGAAELALSGLSGLSARSPCSASVSPSVASPCSLSCSFRDLSLGSRRPTNDAPSTIVEGADPAGTGGSFGEAATQERSQMVHGRARFESRRRLPPSDPRGAAEEGETTGPDCSANVITALLTGADERSAEQPASIAPSSSAPLQSVGSRLLQRIAYIASLGWASAPHCASASDGSSAHEGGQREAEEWPALHFSWADEIDGPERLVDVDSVASGCRFSAELVGSFSCHGCRQLGSGPVRAKVNQDAAIICHPFGPKPQRGGSGGFFDAQAASSERTAVFCVLDGHGHCGEVVSRAAGLRLCEELQAHPRLQHEPHVAMFEAFAATEAALEAELAEEEEGDEEPGWLRRASKNSGACCTLVLLRDGEIWTANAGECALCAARAWMGMLAPTCTRAHR